MIIVRKIAGKACSLELCLVKGVKKIRRVRPERYYLDLKWEKGRYVMSKFRSEEGILQPKIALDLIKSNLIYISKDPETSAIQSQLISFFRRYGSKVYLIDLCRYCIIDGFLTGTTGSFVLYNTEKICLNCAKKEIEREMKFRNIAYSKKILDVLRRLRDVDKVLQMFDPRIDVTKSPSLTLLDRMPADRGQTKVYLKDISLPQDVSGYLERAKISYLLPVQAKAVEAGLLDGKSLLIMSATASGKTLVAEMAGVCALRKRKKLIYLTPLVALANQKYEDFRRRWKKHGVSIRVGMSRIRSEDDLVVVDSGLDSDVIVGTYEGLDYLLRAGAPLGDVGCVVIDEVHMLNDPERGFRLAGLISRVRTLHPKAQIVGLSATIGNPEELSKDLDMGLVTYEKRPIPLERHMIFKAQNRKQEVIASIVKKEWETVSKTGYRGQTMIFTNSRLNCSQLASYLVSRNINAAAYHSGLSYSERKKIEKAYWKQKLQCVVTTAALAAGVDFPSSAVVLESVFMGAEKLSVGEFHQMLGRAGRPGYHDAGKVYLVIDPMRVMRNESEDKIAFSLLENSVEDVDVLLTEEQELEDLLASLSTGHTPVADFNNTSLWPLALSKMDYLTSNGFVKKGAISPLGRAVATSFLSVKDAAYIRSRIRKDPVDVATVLVPFENVYLTKALQSMLDTSSSRLFSGEVLEKIENADAISKLPLSARDVAMNIVMEFFSCECGNPHCEHPPIEVARHVVEMRENGLSPKSISRSFARMYDLQLYSGDVFSYLDQFIHKLEAFERIAKALRNEKAASRARNAIRSIER